MFGVKAIKSRMYKVASYVNVNIEYVQYSLPSYSCITAYYTIFLDVMAKGYL